MTRKELIRQLAENHNEQTVKLLRNFPTILRDLYVMEDYEEAYRLYQGQGRKACLQWSRDVVLERYRIGKNTFYEIRKRVEWLLARTPENPENPENPESLKVI